MGDWSVDGRGREEREVNRLFHPYAIVRKECWQCGTVSEFSWIEERDGLHNVVWTDGPCEECGGKRKAVANTTSCPDGLLWLWDTVEIPA